MIKVLVAEDELPLLRGIKNMIESLNTEFKVVMCAKNGKEALNYLKENQVDVIFTDINMPMVDGLELLKYTKEQEKRIQTVIISGYNEFSYAQKALKYGAKNYLLKPVDRAELKDLLKVMQQEFESTSYEEKYKILAEALFGNPGEETDFPFEEETYALYFCAGSLTSYMTEELTPGNEYWGKNNLAELAGQVFGDKQRVFNFYGKSLNEMILILEGIKGNDIELITLDMLSRLDSSLPVAAAYSEFSDTGQLKTVSHLLRKLIRSKWVFGETLLVNKEPERKELSIELSKRTALEFALKKEQYEHIKQILLDLKKEMRKAGVTQKNLENVMREILIVLYKLRPETMERELSNLEADISDLTAYSNTLDHVFDDFLILCKGIIRGEEYEGGQEIMKKVDDYIRNHIAVSLTTKMLAAKFGLVAPYLSKLFKNYKGETPSQYIQNIRINNAKELLVNYPDMLAKDVAEMVGYSNPLYFSKTFKKNVGVYPSDFRSQNRK